VVAGDGGGLDELLNQMGMLQAHLSQAEESIGHEQVEGSAGGGAVIVRASGEFSFDAVLIDPAVMDAGDVSIVEDLVLAAIRDAAAKLQGVRQQAMGAAVSGALGGLFGTLSAGASDLDDLDDLDEDDEDDEDDDLDGDEQGPPASSGPLAGGPH